MRKALQAVVMIGVLLGVFSNNASGQATAGAHIEYGIVYNNALDRYEVTYQTNSLAPTTPATVMTAQLFIVFSDVNNGSSSTPNGTYSDVSFIINTNHNNGTWAMGDYINGPTENPGKDYLGFYLESTGTTAIELDTINEPAILFTFTIDGPCPGSMAVLEASDPFHFDPFNDVTPNSMSLNINNNFDVLFPRTPSQPTSWWIPGYMSNYTSGTGECGAFLSKKEALDSTPLEMAADDLRLYPNPAKNYVKVISPNITHADVRIHTNDGRQVLTLRNHDLNSGIDLRKLSSGNYYIKMSNGINAYVQRLTIAH